MLGVSENGRILGANNGEYWTGVLQSLGYTNAWKKLSLLGSIRTTGEMKKRKKKIETSIWKMWLKQGKESWSSLVGPFPTLHVITE